MPRRSRRTRLQRGGMTATERWALTVGDDVGMPAGEEYPFATNEQARACWRKHRDVLMSEAYPGAAPCGLWAHEPESFVSAEAIRALRLNAEALHHGANEFDGMARAARRNGRGDLAEEFEQRAVRVRAVLAEMESTHA
jgi:hypothetical protein